MEKKECEKNIQVTRSSLPGFQEYCEEIRDIWDSRWLTNMGAKHEKLQKELESYLDVPHVTLFSNGHLALENAIASFEFEKGKEIITTPFTFVSTTHAIARNGLKPVFCDIDPVSYTIDTEKMEELITEDTVAILPVHVYGNVCNVEKVQEIADKYNLKVIYDAAHAFGVKYKGTGIGNFGDISMISFHATKVFNTIEGGCCTYANPDYIAKLNDLKNFGIQDIDVITEIGGNAKMNEFQAAMGICNLRHISEQIQKRKVLSERYDELLGGIDGIRLRSSQNDVVYNYIYYPVLFDGTYDRNNVQQKLKENGVFTRKYFYPLTSSVACYSECRGNGKEQLKVANYVADHILTLPLYADLELADVDRICRIIKGEEL